MSDSPFNRKLPPKPFTLEEGRRQVRSFVLRQGRFTEAQQRAFDTLWPRYGLDYTGTLPRGPARLTSPGVASSTSHMCSA